MARREFWQEIHDLAAEGLTVLVSTHYMEEAERCHEIAYIAAGADAFVAAVREALHAPADRIARGVAAAAHETWDAIFARMWDEAFA